jgi:hypothetical protein
MAAKVKHVLSSELNAIQRSDRKQAERQPASFLVLGLHHRVEGGGAAKRFSAFVKLLAEDCSVTGISTAFPRRP